MTTLSSKPIKRPHWVDERGGIILHSVVFICYLSVNTKQDNENYPCQGLAMGILGPTQPYLAKQVSDGQFRPIYASYTIQPDNDDNDMMMIIMLVIITMCLPRSVCPTTRSASSGPAAPLVTAWRPSSPASSSGYLAHHVLKHIQDLFLSQEVHLQIVAEVGLPSRLPSPLWRLWTAGPSHLQLPPSPPRSSWRGLLHRQLQHGQQLVSRLHARP